MREIIPLEEVIETASQIIEEQKYTVKSSKDPRKKRNAQAAIRFWTSVNHHLEIHKSLISSLSELLNETKPTSNIKDLVLQELIRVQSQANHMSV